MSLFITVCKHGVDLTFRPCNLCDREKRYLDLDSPDAERRLAAAIQKAGADELYDYTTVKPILAALRETP